MQLEPDPRVELDLFADRVQVRAVEVDIPSAFSATPTSFGMYCAFWPTSYT